MAVMANSMAHPLGSHLGHHRTIGHDLHCGAHGAARGNHHQSVLHVDLVAALAGLVTGTVCGTCTLYMFIWILYIYMCV